MYVFTWVIIKYIACLIILFHIKYDLLNKLNINICVCFIFCIYHTHIFLPRLWFKILILEVHMYMQKTCMLVLKLAWIGTAPNRPCLNYPWVSEISFPGLSLSRNVSGICLLFMNLGQNINESFPFK